MNLYDVIKKYDKDNLVKLFSIVSVVEEFSLYFGMSLEEMNNYFVNYKMIDFQEIVDYLEKKYNDNDIDKVIDKRKREYYYYSDVLKILSDKGLFFLSLLSYLCNSRVFDNDNFYENQLEELEIEHYSSVMIGYDIKRILIALFHIKRMFDETLVNINKKELYLSERIDSFGFSYGGNDIYPSKNLIINSGRVDKTSLSPRKILVK